MEEQILHQFLGSRRGVQRVEEPLEHRVVEGHARAPDSVEAGGRQPVPRREPRLPPRCVGATVDNLQDPQRIGVFLIAPHEVTGCVPFGSSRSRRHRDADAIAAVGAVHQVDEPAVGRHSEDEREDVVRSGAEGTARLGGDPHQRPLVVGVVAIDDGCRNGHGSASGSDHRHAGSHMLDRNGARDQVDERSRRKALVGVADRGDLAALRRQQDGESVLGEVGVLELVDQDVSEPLLVRLQHVGVLLEQLDGLHQQVVEVHRAGAVEAQLVFAIDLGVFAVEDVGGLRVGLVGGDQLVLPEADDAVNATGSEPFGVEAEVANDVAGEALGVGLVVDAERSRVTEPVGIGTQDAHARRVERADPHLQCHRAHQRCDALAHLARRLVGEGDREDLHRMDALVDEMSDAMSEHTGLARPGTGHHQQRSATMHDRIELIRIQPLERDAAGATASCPGLLGGFGEIGEQRVGRHGGAILRSRCDAGPAAARSSGCRPTRRSRGRPDVSVRTLHQWSGRSSSLRFRSPGGGGSVGCG